MIDRRTLLKLTAGVAGSCISLPGVAARKGRHSTENFDVVIYGGSSAGAIAAVQAARMGKSVAIVNPYSFLGGMTASGLGSVDLRPSASGLTREFFSRFGVESEYQHAGSRIEPHVAEQAFNRLVADLDIPLFHNERLDLARGVMLRGSTIDSIRTETGRTFTGKVFIDASYEGDVMAKAGVRYVIGRESNAQYGETLNGVQRVVDGDMYRLSDSGDMDRITRNVDPYVSRGNPASGLLPLVSRTHERNGTADSRLQAYNYRLILTDNPENQIPFEKPDGYRELDHELLLRNFEAGDERLPGRMIPLPNQKYDWNSAGAIGTDFLTSTNLDYPDGTHERRLEIDTAHELYTRGHLWTLANHPRVPDKIRAQMSRYGFAKDEFKRNSGFPYMLYLREGRRMVSAVVMTEHHCRYRDVVGDPVSLASYAMDSHVVRYIVNEGGHLEQEGIFHKHCVGTGGAARYGISYRSIVPLEKECSNLFVLCCISATHVAYSSYRMEPDFMMVGQAAATAASMAIDKNVSAQKVPYAQLRERLQADHVVLDSGWARERC